MSVYGLFLFTSFVAVVMIAAAAAYLLTLMVIDRSHRNRIITPSPPVLLEISEEFLDPPAINRIIRAYLESQLGRSWDYDYRHVGNCQHERDEFKIWKTFQINSNRIVEGIDYTRRISGGFEGGVRTGSTQVLDILLRPSGEVIVTLLEYVGKDEFRRAEFIRVKRNDPTRSQYIVRDLTVSREDGEWAVHFSASVKLDGRYPDFCGTYPIETRTVRDRKITLQP